MSDSVQHHRRQPTRLPRPWDSPGKNMGVGCHFLLQCMQVKSESEVAQSCPTFSDPMDCRLPGFSIHGIFQARVLEWGATAFSSFISYYLLIITKRCSFLDISLWWPIWKLQDNRRLFFIPAFLSGPSTQWKQLWLNVLSHSRGYPYLISNICAHSLVLEHIPEPPWMCYSEFSNKSSPFCWVRRHDSELCWMLSMC